MLPSTEVMKTLVQCDFDGTITHQDAGFLILDAFASGDWRQLLTEYREGKIAVGHFTTQSFGMIKADRQTLLDFIKGKVEVRAGFSELLDYCRRKGFQFVIVSNGLDFYIESILRDIGVEHVEVFAARTEFHPGGVEVKYIGPEGNQLQSDFKETYTRLFVKEGYRVIYVGDGISDLPPAKQAHHVFATGELPTYCKEINISCMPFNNMDDIIKELELLD
jgi:2-hydroxy-3-keto-5-methylthiopentenyl-1-phosphate phosphatase